MNQTHPNREKLTAFAEGTLPEPDASTVENHIAQCETCASVVDRLPALERIAEKFRPQQPQPAPLDAPVRAWMEGLKRLPPSAEKPAAKPKPEVVKPTVSNHSEAVSTPSAAQSSKDVGQLPNQFGRYRILKKIGRGGMGAVYLAHDTKLDRQVALKVPHFSPDDGPEILDRFDREARSAATLDHPNICPVHDVGEIDGIHYISMAFIDGKTLSELIPEPEDPSPPTPLPQSGARGASVSGVAKAEDKTPLSPSAGRGVGGEGSPAGTLRGRKFLPERQVAAVIRKLAQALDYAHSRGIVHRDLKPSNIMVNQHRQLVIMDFGLAKRLPIQSPASPGGAAAAMGDAPSKHGTPTTFSGQIIGTPAYMSPEQALCETKSIGPVSDIYSLGVIMYEMLTGRLPFEGPLAAVLGQIMVSDPSRPSTLRHNLDPQLEQVCLKAISKKTDDRYGSMAEFATALTAFLAKGTHAAQPRASAIPRSARQSVAGMGQTDESLLGQLFAELASKRASGSGQPAAARPRAGWHHRLPIWSWCAAAAAVLIALGGVVLRIQTANGTVQIELNAPDAKVEIKVDGDTIDIAGLDKPLRFRVGDHHLLVTGDNFETKSEAFTVKRGENPVLQVTLMPKSSDIVSDKLRAGQESPVNATIPIEIQRLKDNNSPNSYALRLDALNTRIDIPTFKYSGGHPITIEAIVTPETLIGRLVSDAGNAGFILLRKRQEQGWEFGIFTDNGDKRYQTTGQPRSVVIGKRVHIAAIYDLRELHLYVDGKLNGATAPVNGRFSPSGTSITIGANGQKGGIPARTAFVGLVEQFRISNRARYTNDFTPDEVLRNDDQTDVLLELNEGVGSIAYDSSGKGNHGRITGATWEKMSSDTPSFIGPAE